MTTPATTAQRPHQLSQRALRRLRRTEGGPLFLADWLDMLFLHYRVPAHALQPHVPFTLDLHRGHAWVSIVAFRMQRFRFARGGPATRWLTLPTGRHRLLNLRTYVRHRGEPGIYFLREWIDHPLNLLLGPLTFGLPYHLGRLRYQHHPQNRQWAGTVTPARGSGNLQYHASLNHTPRYRPATPGSDTAFLLERYTAFTQSRGRARRFRIWHHPWAQAPIDPHIPDASLLQQTGPWAASAQLAGGHVSPGVRDVWMGRPVPITHPAQAHAGRAQPPLDEPAA